MFQAIRSVISNVLGPKFALINLAKGSFNHEPFLLLALDECVIKLFPA